MKDTIDMARESGLDITCDPTETPWRTFVEGWDDQLKAFEALVRADERADIQKGFAGVKLWLGDAQVTQLVTEVEIQHERVPGTALKQAAEKCLAIYAGARGNT